MPSLHRCSHYSSSAPAQCICCLQGRNATLSLPILQHKDFPASRGNKSMWKSSGKIGKSRSINLDTIPARDLMNTLSISTRHTPETLFDHRHSKQMEDSNRRNAARTIVQTRRKAHSIGILERLLKSCLNESKHRLRDLLSETRV